MTALKQLVKKIFQYEARLVLKKYKPRIIAVTGSVGKTLTKDLLYHIISKKVFIRKSQKSFTAELGVPLSIIGCDYGGSVPDLLRGFFIGLKVLLFKLRYPDWLILELDGDKPGDLAGLSTWLSPDILIVTEIGNVPSHIETFDSNLSKFLAEKKNLVDSVCRDGVIIANADDENAGRLVHGAPVRKVLCGTTPECNVRMSDYTLLYGAVKNIKVLTGMSFEIIFDGKSFPVSIFSYIGPSIQCACLLSVSVAFELGISPEESVSVLSRFSFPPGRMKILAGIKETTLIDDSYNSSPVAVEQAVQVLSRMETSGRKIAVVGDMFELGKFSADEHKKISRILKDVATFVVCVGIRSRRISEELLSLGFNPESVICFDTSPEAGKFLQNFIQEGDTIFIKGSQSMRMERVAEEIMRHPEDKSQLLVRQEPKWLERE